MTTTISGTDGVDKIKDGAIQTADFAAGVGPVFTKYYESPEQTITAGGSLTLAHGLGVAPKLMQARIICKTADVGYSIGDEVVFSNSQSTSVADSYATSFSFNGSSNIDIRYGSTAGLLVPNKGTGTGTAITPANWRLVVRAWA